MSEYTNPYVNYNIYNDAYSARANGFPEWGSQNVNQYGSSEFPSWGSENIRGYGDSGEYGDWQQQGGGMNYGQAAQSAMAGLSAGQAFGVQHNEFQISGGNILGGAATGAASGASAGPVGAAVGAIVGAGTSFFKQEKALKKNIENVNTSFNGVTDIYGRPVFNSGEFAQGLSDLQGLNDGIRKANRAPMGVRRLKQLGNKRRDLYEGIQSGQQNFNQAESNFRNRSLQFRDYFERQNDQSRLYNLYRY